MIKKISQLDPIRIVLSSQIDNTHREISEEEKKKSLLELSYKTKEADEPPTYGYYNSYQCDLFEFEDYIGLDWVKTIVSALTSDHFTFSSNLWIGTPGSPNNDGIDTYYPNNNGKGLSVFIDSEFHNDVEFHDAVNFHNVANFARLINGVAYRAQWGDLAEYYETDDEYEPGTLLQFGGTAEMTIAKTDVNGIVSTKPGFILNGKDSGHTTVAVCGKVPVKIIGPVKKFDKIVLSEIPGIGVAKSSEDRIRKTIAVALESSDDTDVKSILCTTRLNLD